MKAIVGKKVGMTQLYAEDGRRHSVTVVDVSDAYVSNKLGDEQVSHVELGFGTKKNSNKSLQGLYKQAGRVPQFKTTINVGTDTETPEIGTKVSANIFEVGDKIDVIGITKGKGFQGVMKRHNFKGGPRTHGGPTGKMRHGGSIGSGTTPGRVIKGMKMPGHMGNERQTIQNLKVVHIDEAEGLIAVSGSIPGMNGTHVLIKTAVKAK